MPTLAGSKMGKKRKRNADRRASKLKKPGLLKRLGNWLFSAAGVFAVAVTIAGVIVIWDTVRPKLQVTPKENPPNVFNAEFIAENRGMFTLDECTYTIFGEFSYADGVLTELPDGKGKFRAPPPRMQHCGQIPPGQSRTLTFPIQFASHQWKDDAFVCFDLFYRVYVLWRTKSDSFCFSAEKKQGRDHWISQPPRKPTQKQPEKGKKSS